MKKIALFGGSFNPPHSAHFETADCILKSLGVDEVWFLFSLNPQKDPSLYAPLHHRIAMGNIMAEHYPDRPFIMSGIEDELGTHITHEVLSGLTQRFPGHKFIWTMGADNLDSFHTWEHSDIIIENFPIAVLDRQGYSKKAKNSVTAKTYSHLHVADAKNLVMAEKGWSLLNNPAVEMASRHLLADLRNGIRKFDEKFQKVADYIVLNKLYDIAPQVIARPEVGPDLTP